MCLEVQSCDSRVMGVWEYEDFAAAGEEGKLQHVCVTGSWGLLSSWLVRSLLAKGYNVRSTVHTTAGEVLQNPEAFTHYNEILPAAAAALNS